MERFSAIAGGFCAACLVYLVAGEAAALALAVPYDARVPPVCWPMAAFALAFVECESATAQALWFGAIGIPNHVMLHPATAIEAVAAPYVLDRPFGVIMRVVDMRYVVVGTVIVAAIAAVGARHIAARAPAVAWLLVAALVAEAAWMAYLSMTAPWKFVFP